MLVSISNDIAQNTVLGLRAFQNGTVKWNVNTWSQAPYQFITSQVNNCNWAPTVFAVFSLLFAAVALLSAISLICSSRIGAFVLDWAVGSCDLCLWDNGRVRTRGCRSHLFARSACFVPPRTHRAALWKTGEGNKRTKDQIKGSMAIWVKSLHSLGHSSHWVWQKRWI